LFSDLTFRYQQKTFLSQNITVLKAVPTVGESTAEIGRNRTHFLRLICDDGWNSSDNFAAEFGLRCAPNCQLSSAKQTYKQNLKINFHSYYEVKYL
jgi:hypothetical protein